MCVCWSPYVDIFNIYLLYSKLVCGGLLSSRTERGNIYWVWTWCDLRSWSPRIIIIILLLPIDQRAIDLLRSARFSKFMYSIKHIHFVMKDDTMCVYVCVYMSLSKIKLSARLWARDWSDRAALVHREDAACARWLWFSNSWRGEYIISRIHP